MLLTYVHWIRCVVAEPPDPPAADRPTDYYYMMTLPPEESALSRTLLYDFQG